MGIFDRFRRVVKSNLNDMISKAENPEKMLNQLLVEMQEQLIESKKSVASAIADEKKLERQMNQNLSLTSEWENKAKLAVKAVKDGLAKEALLRRQEYQKLGEQYREQWQAQHDSVEKLKQALRQLQQKIEEAQRKKNLLIARAKRADAQKRIQETITGINNTSAFEAFDQMSSRVERIEAEAEAMQELGGSEDKTIEQEFAALESSGVGDADLLLEDLKQRMKEEDTTS